MTTCLNAVAPTAAASRTPVPITDRQLLWEGGIIQIEVPLEARQGQVDDGEKTITYLQWKKNVVGGMINFFLHVPPEQIDLYRGDTTSVKVKVWRKDLKDQRSFIYVDLAPTSDTPTNELYALNNLGPKQKASVPYPETAWTTIETPLPLQGAVVIVSLDAPKSQSLSTAATKLPPPLTTKAPSWPAPKSTGDGQLDRLLAAGWTIASKTDKVINLHKGDKTIVHHKPKAKIKGKKH